MTGLIVILVIPLGLFADYFYYEKVKIHEVKKGMVSELSSTYGDRFMVREISYGKALGDEAGTYTAEVYPEGNKGLEFQVILSEDGKIISESYKESKWRSEAIESWKPVMNKFGITSYAVNIHIPDEIAVKYDLEDTYLDLYQKHKDVMDEYLFIAQIEKSFDKKKETARVMEMTNYALQRKLRYFSIDWTYYENGNKDAGVFELRKTTASYRWRFSKDAVSTGVTEENLDRFFIQHKE